MGTESYREHQVPVTSNKASYTHVSTLEVGILTSTAHSGKLRSQEWSLIWEEITPPMTVKNDPVHLGYIVPVLCVCACMCVYMCMVYVCVHIYVHTCVGICGGQNYWVYLQ